MVDMAHYVYYEAVFAVQAASDPSTCSQSMVFHPEITTATVAALIIISFVGGFLKSAAVKGQALSNL